jgi:nucleoside-diphosphate-sugar epimerase
MAAFLQFCRMNKVLVTGISGFLGSHIAAEGLRRGYQIRGSIRDKSKKQQVDELFLKQGFTQLPELAEANLLEEGGWAHAVAGCDGIMHVASPFILGLPAHENDLIRPAVEGVKNVLKAALENQVHRIVQTSSIAAIMYGHPAGKIKFDENDWTRLDGSNVSPYTKSKTMAELEFWEIGKRHPELKLTSICPGFVTGPLLNSDAGTSVEVFVRMMKGEYPGVPRLGFAVVDVRDVAALHWDAYENTHAVSRRYPATSASVWFRDLAAMILDARPEFSSKVKTRQLPDWFMHIFSIFDKPVRMILPELGFCAEVSSKAAIRDLRFHPMGVGESVRDTVESILKMGIVAKV